MKRKNEWGRWKWELGGEWEQNKVFHPSMGYNYVSDVERDEIPK